MAVGRGPMKLLVAVLVCCLSCAAVEVKAAAASLKLKQRRLGVKRHLQRINKPALKSIQSPDGDIIDCVHISHQPAFDHPSIKNHTIQMRPSYHPEGLFSESKTKTAPKSDPSRITQMWHLNGKCPLGTVPIRRTKGEDVTRAGSIKRFGRKKHRTIPNPQSADPDLINERGHQHAITYVEGDSYYGAKATINVWEPRIQQPNEFSISQLWILGGSFGQDLNSIEAGWQVSPDLYGDTNTRLFTYWTSDAYQATGCYNLLCSGFIQINNEIAMGASISPISGYGHSQYDISILVWKDPKEGHWWMQFGNDYVLGYWPSFLFSYLADSASMIEWGGEVVNSESDGEHTSTQMGSGHFPGEGFGKSSYFRNIQVVDGSNNLRPPAGVATFTEQSNKNPDTGPLAPPAMEDFPDLLARDFGIRPQGKSAPMSASKSDFSVGSGSATSRSAANPLDSFDVFGGPPKYPNHNPNSNPNSYDPIFDFNDPKPNTKSSSMPVYDKPVYDDDIFDGVPGMKSSAKDEFNNVFVSLSKSGRVGETGVYDDLLGSFARSSSSRVEPKRSDDMAGFDDLIPGFGGSSPPTRREPTETKQQKTSVPSAKPFAAMPEDPFVVLETTTAPTHSSSAVFNDPLEHIGKPMNSGSANFDTSPGSGGIFNDIDAFDVLAKSVPVFENNGSRKDTSPLNSGSNRSHDRSSVEPFNNVIPKTQSSKSFEHRRAAQSPASNDNPFETNATADQSPRSFEHLETADDVWLTVAEIPLFTQPTSAPPPSRAPPHLVIKSAPYGRTDPRRKDNESYLYPRGQVRRSSVSPLDEFDELTANKPQSNEHTHVFSSEDDIETNSAAAAAMKEAMDMAEAKFKHAKEVRERERDARSTRSREYAQQEIDENATSDSQDGEVKQEKMDHERLQREGEERERELTRLEKEREEREKARKAVERATREARERAATGARAKAERAVVDKVNAEARQRAERAAVQRAAAEARERAAAEAHQRAAEARERAAAEANEKAASDRAAAEARQRAAEARERAAAEAKEKAASDRAATEARDRAAVQRAAAEARARAGRAAVEKANAEARERAAAAAKERMNKTENDLDSFFGMGARANSAPKQRAPTTENIFDTQAQRGSVDVDRRTASTSSTFRKASSTTSLVDDLTSVFGVPQSTGEFQEVEGESEERRRARVERNQRTLERAAKALAEKNQRDMQTQMDQAERHKFADTLDMDIRRWAAGKQGNLRALLSTLQYVLWPECGWQPVSLTDLITGDKVKKAYRKATLCIHPDKVQQKGATLQQKYIAEKVFDLLKEAWNKLNSEELF